MNPDTIVNMLEPLRAPAPVSWWPPAPGWWLLATLALLLLGLALRWLWRFHRRGAPLRAARAELGRIEEAVLDSAARAEALARLQRRVAIRLTARSACAGLTGERWADFLNGLSADGQQHFDAAMTELEYRDTVGSDECTALLEATRGWLGALARPQ